MEIFKAETLPLDKATLKTLAARLEDEIDDTEDLRDMVLGQSGQHISSKNAQKFDGELNQLREKLKFIKSLLSEKQ